MNFDLRKAIVLILFLVLPLVSINMQQSPARESNWFDRPFTWTASQVQSGFFLFADGIRGTTSMYLNLIGIKKKTTTIEQENNELKARLQQMAEIESENGRLRGLLEFRDRSPMKLVAAQVMSRDLVSDHNTLQIDKGMDHGLIAGQAVITTDGAVGYIFKPESKTSLVMLVTDRYAVIDGVVARSRARGIVEGKSGKTCSLRYVEKSEDVVVGDLIVTSGLDNIFPKGFPVARVTDVESKPYAVSLRVDLVPVVDPNKVEDVFVILDAANQDLSVAQNQ
jgi:rod shape-determining protein MreC